MYYSDLLKDCCNLNEHCNNVDLGFQESKYYIIDEEYEIVSLEDEFELDDFKETCLFSLVSQTKCFTK